jgi:hypothetical protein
MTEQNRGGSQGGTGDTASQAGNKPGNTHGKTGDAGTSQRGNIPGSNPSGDDRRQGGDRTGEAVDANKTGQTPGREDDKKRQEEEQRRTGGASGGGPAGRSSSGKE